MNIWTHSNYSCNHFIQFHAYGVSLNNTNVKFKSRELKNNIILYEYDKNNYLISWLERGILNLHVMSMLFCMEITKKKKNT